jgi:hypothetical protein
VAFELPVVPLADVFPGIEDREVRVPVAQLDRPRDMVLPLTDLLTLAAVCVHTRPRRIFEIGTYTGSSTLLMAMHCSADTEIFTLDLEPSTRPQGSAFDVGLHYRDTPYAAQIRQLFGNSRSFDFRPFRGTMDLIYIDAEHTYEAVKADSEIALQLVAPSGMIIWDDYRWLDCHSECAGVTRCLNELALSLPCFQIAGTRLAAHVRRQGGDNLAHP